MGEAYTEQGYARSWASRTLRRNVSLRGQPYEAERGREGCFTLETGAATVGPLKQPIRILLAEDNLADVKLIEKCLRNITFPYHLSVVGDGEAAIAFLKRQVPYTTAPRPNLLLLSTHLPKQSGWDVLAWVRAQPALSRLPVVMLTGVFSLLDEERIDRLQPTRCLLKPRDPEDYLRVGQALERVLR